jgi:hypothetical protein
MIQVKRVYGPPDILDAARQGTITLIFSAHDQEHNSALALKVSFFFFCLLSYRE